MYSRVDSQRQTLVHWCLGMRRMCGQQTRRKRPRPRCGSMPALQCRVRSRWPLLKSTNPPSAMRYQSRAAWREHRRSNRGAARGLIDTGTCEAAQICAHSGRGYSHTTAGAAVWALGRDCEPTQIVNFKSDDSILERESLSGVPTNGPTTAQ